MRRAIIYALLFPLFAAAFMFAAQRINPLNGDPVTRLVSVYALGFAPAIATAWTHDALRHRGYRSIFSIFVGAAGMAAIVYFVLHMHEPNFVLAYAIAGLFAALSCWVISRVGQKR
jgi:peptidoglycan/LPS O-acetylase OafA/YrhL